MLPQRHLRGTGGLLICRLLILGECAGMSCPRSIWMGT
jgi:hypothetical protein